MTQELAQSAPGEMARLLLVDDEEIVLAALHENLKHEGYTILTAPNGIQALELLRQHQFAAVFTDQQMPGLTGLELLVQVKTLQPDATRVLITAVLNFGTVLDAINKAEVFRFLLKPWSRQDLLETVRDAVSRHDALRHDRQLLARTLALNETLSQLNQSLAKQLEQNRDEVLE